MVLDLEMYQFMDDDIIYDLKRSHYQAPGETQCTFGATGSPACAGRAEPYFGINQGIPLGEEFRAAGKYLPGLCLIPFDKDRSGMWLI